MKRWIARFLAGLRESSSPHTLRAYAQNTAALAEFCERQGVTDPKDLTHRLLRAWLAELNGRGLKRATIARYLAAVRAYTRFLVREGVLAKDPAQALRTPRRERPLPLPLGENFCIVKIWPMHVFI